MSRGVLSARVTFAMKFEFAAEFLSIYIDIDIDVALSPWEMIGSFGVRNFMLCKKARRQEEIKRKNSGSWKSWFNKSL